MKKLPILTLLVLSSLSAREPFSSDFDRILEEQEFYQELLISQAQDINPIEAIESYLPIAKTLECCFPYNPYVPIEIWERMEPYFMPADHPAKNALDDIFGKNRVILDSRSFKKAGFNSNRERRHSGMMVSTHPRLVGYYVKVYSDEQKDVADWEYLLHRIQGAEIIRECIQQHGFDNHFKVPCKWIYPLPTEPSPPMEDKYLRKNFILIAEDARTVGHDKNNKKYKRSMTPQLLDEMFLIVTETDFSDLFNFNIPWCKDGKMCFIDTEDHHIVPVCDIPYWRMGQALSPRMKRHWDNLWKGVARNSK